MSQSFDDIYTVVHLIPEGKVATYGQVARIANRPNGARQVGYALAALSRIRGEHDIPWHRVISAQGKISLRSTSDYEDYQQILLEEEGVEFGLNQVINLEQYLWEA
jgi:methylated-DNA-protein-cysteine methyltransferase-like protein